MQLNNEQFGNIIISIGNKLKTTKGIELFLPDNYAKDLTSKYRDAQMIAEFLKKLGYKGDLNMNNILFPSLRDIQRILEFLLEQVTNSDSNAVEFNENFSEKNFLKLKISQKFSNWSKDPWILPEIEQELKSQEYKNKIKKILKYENTTIQGLKKIVKEINLDNNSKTYL